MFRLLAYVYFAIFSLCILLPFYVMLKTSLTSNAESLSTMRFIWFPQQGVTLEAYQTAMFSDILKTYDISIFKSFFQHPVANVAPRAHRSVFLRAVGVCLC